MAKKQPPNPYGKKGGLKHQAKAKEENDRYRSKGYQVRRELMIKINAGIKTKRFVDLAVLLGGAYVVFVQVCRMNKDGKTPVKRERNAAEDITLAHPNVPIKFVDYEK